ncbi:MAG: uracil-DNA glycosylase [Nitrospirae bacterium]|nr:uracil-DNA glycosylase [Nitrospirota bacterium]
MKSKIMEYNCAKCERLVEYRTGIRPKKSLEGRSYRNLPVPDFGDPEAWLLIIGLAPGAHGANRTGRPFQGDGAGTLLYASLHDVGFCNTEKVTDFDPGIRLSGVLITNAVRCAPPENKPTPKEFNNCRTHLMETLTSPDISDILCIGKDAYDQLCKALGIKGLKFFHGLHQKFDMFRVHCSYHTSTYNQNTGRISKASLSPILHKIIEFRKGD